MARVQWHPARARDSCNGGCFARGTAVGRPPELARKCLRRRRRPFTAEPRLRGSSPHQHHKVTSSVHTDPHHASRLEEEDFKKNS